MIVDDIDPEVITGFKGLWSRGALKNVPKDHLSYCDNCTFPGQDTVSIREGLDQLDFSPGLAPGEHIISAFPYSVIRVGVNSTDFLFLTDFGNLIDGASNVTLGNFTGGFANPDDMSCINLYGRVFVSLKARGIAWENASPTDSAVHYFDGINYVPLGGAGPSTAPTLSETAIGLVTAGRHIVAVSYLYKYGYISPPSPLVFLDSDGTHNLQIDNIPISANPLVIGRVILITIAGGGKFFFVPGGTINDNVTTSFIFDAADSVLLSPASYLQDIISLVPNGSALKFYKGRLVIVGPHGVENNILFSNQLSPETFDVVTGAVQLPADFVAMDPNTGLIINDTFYILKPNGTYSTQDNGGDPSTWNVTSLDAGLGGWDTGVSSFGGNYTDILDNSMVCSPRGLILFNGAYQDIPLSFKIEDVWKSIDTKQFYLVQIAHDIWNKRVYILAPLNNSTFNSHILMMDYSEGLNPQSVKWSKWLFADHSSISKMFQGVLLISGSGAQNISQNLIIIPGDGPALLTIKKANTQDENTTFIAQKMRTAPLSPKKRGVYVFLMIVLDIVFYQKLNITAMNGDISTVYLVAGFDNTAGYYNGQELYKTINITTEQIIIELSNNPVNAIAYFTLHRLDLYARYQWAARAALTQAQ